MKNIYLTVFLPGILAFPLLSGAGDATAPYQDSRIDARLNLEVQKDTQVVHFVRDNVDPDVVTKTYVLKHADPYEIRGYLRMMVQSRKVDLSDTGIQAIKYNDGTGILMVSAEDYRFENSANGQGIDSIIAELDKPEVISVTGQPMYLYQPKYRSARELAEMVTAAGANVSEDVTENIGGSDRIRNDKSLNLLFFKTTQFSRKNIANVLTQYDRPYPEIRANITVYEIYEENDAKIGADFQAWKNNDGIDLFNGGARFMQNYAQDGSSLTRGSGWSNTKYFNFNPKWNTKYIDFLTSKGKAKIVHSCELTVRNRTTAKIERTNSLFLATTEAVEPSEYTVGYIYLPDSTFIAEPPQGKTPVAGWKSEEVYVVSALTSSGKAIRVAGSERAGGATGTVTILQTAKNMEAKYFLTVEGGFFEVDERNVGSSVEASYVEVTSFTAEADNGIGTYSWSSSPVEFDTDGNIAALKGNKINTTPSNEFGFCMSLTPSISEKATILDIRVSNSSLIGYKSNGEARIQQGAILESSFMIANEGTKLVIGGIEKRDVVSISGGIPVLKAIPVLGWLFSTESESTKKSQLLVVAEVVPSHSGNIPTAKIAKIEKTLKKAGESNTFGYRQYGLDSERAESYSEVQNVQ